MITIFETHDRYERPPVQWWPLRLRYLRRIHQYRQYTGGRCSPVALMQDAAGNQFEADIVRPARHALDTWEVKAYRREGCPEYEVATRQILDIQCGRVVAGYSC